MELLFTLACLVHDVTCDLVMVNKAQVNVILHHLYLSYYMSLFRFKPISTGSQILAGPLDQFF